MQKKSNDILWSIRYLVRAIDCFDQLTPTLKERISELLNTVAAQFHSEIISWDIEVSAAKNYFRCMERELKEWEKHGEFKDRQVLRFVACEVIGYYISKERQSDSHFNYLLSEIDSGELMTALGFYEDAFRHFNQARSQSAWQEGAGEMAKKGIRKLVASYRELQRLDKEFREFERWFDK